jgi:integrase
MASAINKLTALKIRNMAKPGVYGDGNNLFLQVASKGGAKSWVFRYAGKADGKTKAVGLGSINAVSLADARQKAQDLRRLMADGKDPATELAKTRHAEAAKLTFDQAAEQYIAAMSPAWSNAKHIAQWTTTLNTYASPIIGSLPVDAVDTGHVLRILRPIWTAKTETATRVRQRVERVLAWSKSQGFRSGDNPAAWKDHLANLLPKPEDVAATRHHPALPWQQVPSFIAALRKREGQAAKAIELLILTATRSGEVRGACWPEFDLDAAVWTVPAERMKAGREHHVPLSAAAIKLLKEMSHHEGTDLLFPSRKKTPLSDMTLSMLVRGMNEPKPVWKDSAGLPIVPHGFRSTFRVWAGEATTIDREVAEHALAHQLPNRVEAAYQRSTLFDKRIRLMAEWSAWATSKPGSVVPLRSKVA